MLIATEPYSRCNPAAVKATAKILRAWRRRARLSQRAIAVAAGLDPITVFNAERGKNISDTTLLAILKALGKSVDDLEREAREGVSAIIVEDVEGNATPISEHLVRQAEAAAMSKGKSLAEWVTLAIVAYLPHQPTDAMIS